MNNPDAALEAISPHLFYECERCGVEARFHSDEPDGPTDCIGFYRSPLHRPMLHGAAEPLGAERHLRSV